MSSNTMYLLCVQASCLTAYAAGGVGRPLVAIVSRLTEQKGLPLMLHGMKVGGDCMGASSSLQCLYRPRCTQPLTIYKSHK